MSSVFSASPPYCPSPESPPYCAVPLLPPVPLLPQKLKKRTEKRPERSLKERTVINIYLLVFCEIYFVPLLSFPVPLLTSPSCPVPLQSPPSPVPLLTPVLSLSASPHSLSLLSRLFWVFSLLFLSSLLFLLLPPCDLSLSSFLSLSPPSCSSTFSLLCYCTGGRKGTGGRRRGTGSRIGTAGHRRQEKNRREKSQRNRRRLRSQNSEEGQQNWQISQKRLNNNGPFF